MEEKTLLRAVLDDDQANIQRSTDLLKRYGIFELYEQVVPSLFNDLLPALQQNTPAGYFPFIRKRADPSDKSLGYFHAVRWRGLRPLNSRAR